MMRDRWMGTVLVLLVAGCARPLTDKVAKEGSLVEARKGFQSQIARRVSPKEPVEQPPPEVFQLIQYQSPAGSLAAYLSPDPKTGDKRPAIIWITGGDCNSIGNVWEPAPPENDQTGSAYRQAGLVMMFPSLRGGNTNPGRREGFLGEVDDVLAAADHLAKQTYVDPNRIYLGGHSTGGTLALLVSECTDRFRAVFAFGPVDDVSGYDSELLPFSMSNQREIDLRSPGFWLSGIKSPTFVIEGTGGNASCVRNMAATKTSAPVHCLLVSGHDHFTVLGPANRVIASKIVQDTGPTCNLSLTAAEIK